MGAESSSWNAIHGDDVGDLLRMNDDVDVCADVILYVCMTSCIHYDIDQG